jgi:tripartite-type tricarboxylate transporter receptor subunit TctC
MPHRAALLPHRDARFPMSRLIPVVALALAFTTFGADKARSEDPYPNRPVRVIVPFAPGGVVDVMARLLAQKLSDNLGRQFFVDNAGGAGGNIGTATAASAKADGYTVLMTSSSFVVNPSLHAKVPYDPNKDFAAVSIAAASPNVLVVHPAQTVKTAAELVDAIKKAPGKYSYAHAGVGTTPHLSGELFRLSLGLDLVHVPFTGAGPALQSTVAGHTPMAFTGLPPAVPLIKSGQLRALVTTSSKRLAALPELPTVADAGLAGQDAETLLFVLVPAATPKEIVTMLNREIVKIVALPDVQQKFDTLGFNPMGSTPEESASRVKEEIAKWAKVIRAANIPTQ